MKLIILIAFLGFGSISNAQPEDTLHRLKGISFPVYYSKTHKERTVFIAKLLEKAFIYQSKNLDFKPNINLMVLDSIDWKMYSSPGAPYGMPHYNNDKKRLVVAAQDNAMWKGFLPPADKLSPDLKDDIIKTYGNKDGTLSARAFFDLLAIHELGHAFTSQAGVHMQRQWMSELYCNILLHAFIAEKQPSLLPALTLFPKMVVAEGAKNFKYTSLKDLQENYNAIATRSPRNYGWYQCRWHMAAATIYDTAGKNTGRKLWDAFSGEKDRLSDEAFLEMLDRSGNTAVADMVRNWDSSTIL